MTKQLYLGLGRTVTQEIVGDQFDKWLSDHWQAITDVFGVLYPYIYERLGLGEAISLLRIGLYGLRCGYISASVTTSVDSSQYVWFVHLRYTCLVDPCATVNAPLSLLITSSLTL